MAKRLTDTEKWNRPWFRQLPSIYKNFWVYICDLCDIAGIWYVDMDLASFMVGEKLDIQEARRLFAKQIVELDGGTRWHIPGFSPFQYGQLTPTNNMHRAVLRRLDAIAGRSISAPNEPLTSPLQGAKDKDKEIYKEGVKDVGGSGGFSFDAVWFRYPRKIGRKAAERHFRASVKTPQDFLDIQNALDCFIRQMRKEGREEDKIPYGSTWFNGWRDWVNYGGLQMPKPPAPVAIPRPPDPPEPTDEERLEGLKVFEEFRRNRVLHKIKTISAPTEAELEAEKQRMS